MAIDIDSALPPGATQSQPSTFDNEWDADESWAETVITVVVTVVTLLLVSAIAVLMTMA
jgi:hypothetical protein